MYIVKLYFPRKRSWDSVCFIFQGKDNGIVYIVKLFFFKEKIMGYVHTLKLSFIFQGKDNGICT